MFGLFMKRSDALNRMHLYMNLAGPAASHPPLSAMKARRVCKLPCPVLLSAVCFNTD
jgi:hypothetical protein